MKKLCRDSFLNAGEIINRLKRALSISSDLRLSRFLGVGQQTISSYRSRNKVPYELIVEQANKHNLSLDEILLGKEPVQNNSLGLGQKNNLRFVPCPHSKDQCALNNTDPDNECHHEGVCLPSEHKIEETQDEIAAPTLGQ